MTRDPTNDRLDRLGEAIDAWLAHSSAGSGETDQAFLAAHEDLRDLLEPMLRSPDAADVAPDAPSVRKLGPKTRLGEYRIVREIGRGGMGVVFEAWHEPLDRRVALKVLAPHLTDSPRRVERFRREAAAAAKLNHPGIVPVHAVGEVDGTHFYSMDVVDGKDLAQCIHEARDRRDHDGAVAGFGILGGSPAAEAAQLARQVAEALAHAHAHGVIHRDVKPHNILVADGQARLVDFGLAKDVGKRSLSLSGEFAGTPHYVSPEQASSKRGRMDERTDVYSLGIVLFEMLTLERPFEGETAHDVLHAIASKDPRSLRGLNVDVPRDLETICCKAIEKHPEHRYASVAEFADDLRRFLQHQPILARPPGALTRLGKLARRNRTATLAVGLAFLLAVVAPLLFMLHCKSARDAVAAEQSRTQQALARVRGTLRHARSVLAGIVRRAAAPSAASAGPSVEFARRLMQSGLGFYETFLHDYGDDPSLRADAADAYLKAGRIRLLLGKYDAAREAIRRGLEIASVLRAEHPNAAGVARTVGDFHDQNGELHLRVGSLDAAATSYAEAISTWQQAIPACHDDKTRASLALRIGRTRSELARVYLRRFEMERMAKLLRRGIADLEGVDRGVDADRKASVLARLNESLGIYFSNTRGRKRRYAKAPLARAVDLRRNLLDAAPKDPSRAHALAAALMNYGNLWVRSQKERAATLFGEAQALLEGLVRSYPQVPDYQVALAHLCYLRSKVASLKRDWERVVELRMRGTELVTAVATEHPRIPDLGVSLAMQQLNLGLGLVRLGRNDEAEAAFVAAVARLESKLRAAKPCLARDVALFAQANDALLLFFAKQRRVDEECDRAGAAARVIADVAAPLMQIDTVRKVFVRYSRRHAARCEQLGRASELAERSRRHVAILSGADEVVRGLRWLAKAITLRERGPRSAPESSDSPVSVWRHELLQRTSRALQREVVDVPALESMQELECMHRDPSYTKLLAGFRAAKRSSK